MPDLETELSLLPRAHLNFELEVNVADLGSGFRLECTYNRDLYSADTVQRWLGHFEMLLRGAVASPEIPTAELVLLTDTDRERIVAWNATEAAVPGGPSCWLHPGSRVAATRQPTIASVPMALVCWGRWSPRTRCRA